MPIVRHDTLPETPWRPNYRKWDVTVPGDGTTSSSLSISLADPGTGAPLHTHEDDELIVLLDGDDPYVLQRPHADGILVWCQPPATSACPSGRKGGRSTASTPIR